MLIFPLGLGTKQPKLPLMTLGISVLLFLLFVFEKGHERANAELLRLQTWRHAVFLEQSLFMDFCTAQKTARLTCEGLAEFLDPKARDEKQKTFSAKEKGSVKAPKGKPQGDKQQSLEDLKGVSDSLKILSAQRNLAILKKFKLVSEAPTPAFKRLKSYPDFAKNKAYVHKRIVETFQRDNILSRSNLNWQSLLCAQFRHASWSHLLGNLMIFIIFGIYVEQRLRGLAFVAAYMACGTVGLLLNVSLFLPLDLPLLGASANIAGIMGMFYVFYFHSRMRFFLWFFLSKKVWAPVKYSFPIVFVISDMTGALESLLPSGSSGGVAHFAHLGGLFFGFAIAAAFKMMKPLPPLFIYESEVPKFVNLQQTSSIDETIRLAREMLLCNPDNNAVRYTVLAAIVSQPHSVLPERSDSVSAVFLVENLDAYCAVALKSSQADLSNAYRILNGLPLHHVFARILGSLGQSNVLVLGELAVHQGNTLLAMRFYDAFLMRWRGTRKEETLRQSIREILGKLSATEGHIRALESYRHAVPQSAIAPEIRTRVAIMEELLSIGKDANDGHNALQAI